MWKPLNHELKQFIGVEAPDSAAAKEAQRRAKLFEANPRAFTHDYFDSEVIGVEGIEKTKQETRVCNELIKAVEIFLEKIRQKYVLKHNPLSPEDIHVLEPDVFQSTLGPDEVSVGFHTSGGNIYVPRVDDMETFASTVSHELAHTISHQLLVAQHIEGGLIEERKFRNREILSDIQGVVAGFQFDDLEGGPPQSIGLNEATTELMAQQIRIVFNERTTVIDKKSKDQLETNLDYTMQCVVVQAVIYELAAFDAPTVEQYEGNYMELLQMLFTDYIGGTGYFAAIMEHYMPGTYDALANMGVDTDSPLQVAKDMNLPADVIEHLTKLKSILDEEVLESEEHEET